MLKVRRYIRYIPFSILLFGIVFLHPAPAIAQGNNAYIFLGVEEPSKYDVSIAQNAAERYRRAGYNVIIDFEMSKDDFQRAVNDPHAGVIWFEGHGFAEDEAITTVERGARGQKFEGVLFSSDITVPANSRIQEVVFHACYQDMDSWDLKFPNAVIESWSGQTVTPLIKWWETWVHTILPPDFGASASGGQVQLDPLIRPGNVPFRHHTDGQIIVLTNVFNSWVLEDPLLALYGSDRSFNIFLTGDRFTDPQWLFGGNVIDGLLTAGNIDEQIVDASFQIIMPFDSFGDIYSDRDIWNMLLSDGRASIDVFDSDLDPNVAYRGTGALLLGFESVRSSVPEPSTLILLGIGLCMFICNGLRRQVGIFDLCNKGR